MTPLAAVVLAHADPTHVRRLIEALSDVPVFLHVDAKTADTVAEEMVRGASSQVTLCARLPTSLASWSLVAAELVGLRTALRSTSAEHIAVLSGSDYPLVSAPQLVAELSAWVGSSWMWNQPLPYAPWGTPRHPDGGRWRVEHRFLTRGDRVVYLRDVPLRWPVRRDVPAGLELRASAQWKIYARHHAELVLQIVDRHPEMVRFWRSTLVPEESFATSVLASPTFAGSDALPPCAAHAWYMQWPEGRSDHPEWLTDDAFPALAQVAAAPPAEPAEAVGTVAEKPLQRRQLFARKFSSTRSSRLLDRVDAELRTATP